MDMGLIEGAIISLGSVAAGRLFWPRRGRGPAPEKKTQAVCQCGHGLNEHHPETKTCAGRIELQRYSTVEERKVFDKYGPCACKQYVGPTPYPEYYAPEM